MKQLYVGSMNNYESTITNFLLDLFYADDHFDYSDYFGGHLGYSFGKIMWKNK